MGIEIVCPECGRIYRTREQLEMLKDNESLCLKCRAFIDVDDWDEIMASLDDEDIDISDDFDDDIHIDGIDEEDEEDLDIPEDDDDTLFSEFSSIEDVELDDDEDEEDDF